VHRALTQYLRHLYLEQKKVKMNISESIKKTLKFNSSRKKSVSLPNKIKRIHVEIQVFTIVRRDLHPFFCQFQFLNMESNWINLHFT